MKVSRFPFVAGPHVLGKVLLLAIAPLLFTGLPLTAKEKYGKWEPGERAEAGLNFFARMRTEIQARIARLKAANAPVGEVAIPFIDSAFDPAAKNAADWIRFGQGGMGEGHTSKWMQKGLAELEAARKILAKAEKPAAAAWDKEFPKGKKPVELPKETTAFIYEIEVIARKLGVILDVSPSMRKALPAVRAEITARFPGARFVEVDGCALKKQVASWGPYAEWFYASPLEERNPFDQRWFLPGIPQNDIHYHMVAWERDTFAAFRGLIDLMEVDAIYWFCDFDDEAEPAIVRELGNILSKKKVKLYAHSSKSDPVPALGTIIKHSSGVLTKADPLKSATNPNPAPPAVPAGTPAGKDPFEVKTEPVTPEFVKQNANTNKSVQVKLTVTGSRIEEKNKVLVLTAKECPLTVSVPWSYLPAGADSRDGLVRMFRAGDFVVEVTGRIIHAEPGVPMLNVDGPGKMVIIPPPRIPEASTVTPAAPPVPTPATPPEDTHKTITLSQEDLDANQGKAVRFEATVAQVERMASLNHVKIHFAGTPLFAVCKADRVATVFPGIDPLKDIQAGDKVRIKGSLSLFQKTPMVSLATANQFLTIQRDRPVPGTGGRVRESTKTVEIPAAPPQGRKPSEKKTQP
jgi:hypothetical protein